MKKIVLDASVVLAFLLEEDKVVEKRIVKLFDEVKEEKLVVLSSHLLPLEVGNVIKHKIKDQKEAEDLYEQFLTLKIQYEELSPTVLKYSLRHAYDTNTTVYDSSYLQLSMIRKAILWTKDEKFYKNQRNTSEIELL